MIGPVDINRLLLNSNSDISFDESKIKIGFI